MGDMPAVRWGRTTCLLEGPKQLITRSKGGGTHSGVSRSGQEGICLAVYSLSNSEAMWAGAAEEGVTRTGLCPRSAWTGDDLLCVMPCPVNRKFPQGPCFCPIDGQHKRKYPAVIPWFLCPREQSLLQSVISETNGDRQFCLTCVQHSDRCHRDTKLGTNRRVICSFCKELIDH